MKKIILYLLLFISASSFGQYLHQGTTRRNRVETNQLYAMTVVNFSGVSSSTLSTTFINSVFPAQTSGRYLTTNGTNIQWTVLPAGFSGSYPDLTNKPTIPTQYTDALARAALSATNGISYNSSTGVISKTKRQETYTGTTNASGVVTITYGTAYGATPNVQFSMISTNPREDIRLTASSTTGCSFAVQLRVDVVGLLPSYTNVASRLVSVLVTEP